MDYALITGDTATFDNTAGAATVTLSSATITGSGKFTVSGNNVCVLGDESSVITLGTYINGSFVNGSCTAIIVSDSVTTSSNITSNNKAVLLVSGKFKTKITVTTPAIQPGSPPTPDPTLTYSGTGSFTTSNTAVKG